MSLLADTQTLLAAASAATAVASFLAYLYFMRRSEAHAARDEALALAETRRQVILELRRQLADSERRVRELETKFLATPAVGLLRDLSSDLDHEPPNVARALLRIRRHLDGERPAA
jgi:hypothetical protein